MLHSGDNVLGQVLAQTQTINAFVLPRGNDRNRLKPRHRRDLQLDDPSAFWVEPAGLDVEVAGRTEPRQDRKMDRSHEVDWRGPPDIGASTHRNHGPGFRKHCGQEAGLYDHGDAPGRPDIELETPASELPRLEGYVLRTCEQVVDLSVADPGDRLDAGDVRWRKPWLRPVRPDVADAHVLTCDRCQGNRCAEYLSPALSVRAIDINHGTSHQAFAERLLAIVAKKKNTIITTARPISAAAKYSSQVGALSPLLAMIMPRPIPSAMNAPNPSANEYNPIVAP